MRHLAWGFIAAVVSTLWVGMPTTAQEAPKSGLQVGEFAPPFDVFDVTGPNAGKTLCYR